MPETKHVLAADSFSAIRWLSMMSFLGVTTLGFMPIGCASSIETAPLRYREQHPNTNYLLPDITVERLQTCVEEYGGQIEAESLQVGATVQVDREGQTQDVIVAGVPESAPDFAACARTALRDMSVPAMPLRASSTRETANHPAKLIGNEMANPGVMVEVAVLLGEFMAQHGGKAILYAVTIEVLGTIAVAGTQEMLKRNRWKKNCTDGYVNCIASPAGQQRGNNWNIGRCGTCREVCDRNKGTWPSSIEMFPEGTMSCY